jgi:serine protease
MCDAHHSARSKAIFRPLLLGWLLLVAGLAVSPIAASAEAQSRIIVKWRPSGVRTHTEAAASLRDELHRATGLGLNIRRSVSDQLDVMELDHPVAASDFTQALSTLRAQPDVEYAVADERKQIAALPNDPLVTARSGHSGQWYLLNTEPASINAFAAWDYSKGGNSGAGVVVAVVDTGVRFDHPDLLRVENGGKLLPGYDFVSCDQLPCSGTGQTFLTANDGDGWDADASDPGDWLTSADLQNHPSIFPSSRCTAENSSWHGTRVAGMIGASTNNALGIAGIGWNARILPVRVLGKCGGYDSDIIAGMRWAAGLHVNGVPDNPNPAKVINLSLGGTGSCSPAYADAIANVTAVGASVVASAGNDSAIINTPANCSGVIAVVGVRNVGTKVGFSSLGTGATIAAPAGNCGSTSGPCLYTLDTTTNLGTTTPGVNDYTDQTNYNLGTSFSAPIVSGTIALMLGVNSNLTPAQITTALRASATPFPASSIAACKVPTDTTVITGNDAECACSTNTCGAGIVNAYQAVLAVGGASSSSSSSSASSGSTASTASTTPTTSSSGGGGGTMHWVELMLLSALLMVAMRRRTAHRLH